MPAYRAQISRIHRPSGWVDGGLFGDLAHTIADAERLHDQYGTPARVLKDGEVVWRLP